MLSIQTYCVKILLTKQWTQRQQRLNKVVDGEHPCMIVCLCGFKSLKHK